MIRCKCNDPHEYVCGDTCVQRLQSCLFVICEGGSQCGYYSMGGYYSYWHIYHAVTIQGADTIQGAVSSEGNTVSPSMLFGFIQALL